MSLSVQLHQPVTPPSQVTHHVPERLPYKSSWVPGNLKHHNRLQGYLQSFGCGEQMLAEIGGISILNTHHKCVSRIGGVSQKYVR
jgi:hypothetical protein